LSQNVLAVPGWASRRVTARPRCLRGRRPLDHGLPPASPVQDPRAGKPLEPSPAACVITRRTRAVACGLEFAASSTPLRASRSRGDQLVLDRLALFHAEPVHDAAGSAPIRRLRSSRPRARGKAARSRCPALAARSARELVVDPPYSCARCDDVRPPGTTPRASGSFDFFAPARRPARLRWRGGRVEPLLLSSALRGNRVAAEQDVGAAAGHVGGMYRLPRARLATISASRSWDLALSTWWGIPRFLSQLGEALRLLDGDGCPPARLARPVPLR